MYTDFLVADTDIVIIAVTTVDVALLDAVSTAQSIATTTAGEKVTELASAALVKFRGGRGTKDHRDGKDESESLLEHD